MLFEVTDLEEGELALQREAGLEVLSDGEYRRSSWAGGFPGAWSPRARTVGSSCVGRRNLAA